MGEHKGWRVRQEKRTGTWRGEVRRDGGYQVRTFATAKAARDWASGEAAQVRLGRAGPVIGAALPTEATADRYLADLRARGRSEAHLKDAGLILAAAARACPTLSSPDAPALLEQWLNTLRTSGAGRGGKPAPVSPARRNKYRAVIRALCQWAMRRDLLERDPTRAIEPARTPDFLKPQFSLDELRRLVRYHQTDGWRWAMLMLYAGLRADEARCLRYGDIDISGQVLLIQADSGAKIKRGRERIVPLQSELAMLLTPLGPPAMRVCDLGPGNLGRTFADLLTAAGIEPGARSPHSMRHTYAGLLTATGVPTALVGAYLGHTQASTTMGYTKLAARYVAGVTDWPRGQILLGL